MNEKQPVSLNPYITEQILTDLLETQMTYEKNNAIATYKGEAVSYDKDGNMTVGPLGKSMVNYTYNQFNLLTEVDGTYYKYDGEGRRVSQMDDMGRTTQYVTNPHSSFSELLLSIDPEGIETIYVYGLGLISEEKSDGGRLSNYRVYHYDYRGSTNFLTSGEGKVTDSFIYGPYGELLRQSGDTQTIFMYNGKYGVVTDENGLYYMRARYYNPQIKRFINIDPIKDSYNWFAYVAGDPIRFIDPWGLAKIKIKGNEVDATEINDAMWANPLSLAKAAGFDISNVGNIVRITSGDNYVHLSGVAYVDEQQQTHYFHTTGASYNTTIHNDHFTGKLTVQGSLVDAKAFIMHLNCSLVGAIDLGEGNGDPFSKLESDTTLGLSADKKKTMAGIGRTMYEEGYELAFIAGLLGNIFHEGQAAGYFESSNYASSPSSKPDYLQYVDNNHDYRNKYSGQSIVGKSLLELSNLLSKLDPSNRQGFGLGSVQWTFGRTEALVKIYQEVAGSSDTITFEQAIEAEALMIHRELSGYYNKEYDNIYGSWERENKNNLSSEQAAYKAGVTICKKYERPAYDSSATRGETAQKIHNIMLGQ